eukprot:gene9852-biopygen19762
MIHSFCGRHFTRSRRAAAAYQRPPKKCRRAALGVRTNAHDVRNGISLTLDLLQDPTSPEKEKPAAAHYAAREQENEPDTCGAWERNQCFKGRATAYERRAGRTPSGIC